MKCLTHFAVLAALLGGISASLAAQDTTPAVLWRDLEQALPRHGSASFQATPPTPSAAIDWAQVMEKAEALMVRTAETPVEPFAIFYVANFKFETGRFDEAMALFDTIRQNFPQHPLVTKSLIKDTKPPVIQAIEDCASEIAWRKKYPRQQMPAPALNDKLKATIHTTAGDITIAFYDNVAPKHAKNFLEQVAAGRLDGTKVGRVMAETVVNLGDQTPPDAALQNGRPKGSGLPAIPHEFSNLSHTRGMIAMTRNMGANESSATQFQIILKDQAHLDFQQTIFARVVAGIEVADQISKMQKNQYEMPVQDVVLKGVTVTKP